MSFLTEDIDDRFKFNDKIFHVNMAFDNVLLLHEMFDDEAISDGEKILLALEMLVVECEQLQFSSFEEVVLLYKYVMKEFLGYDIENTETEEKKKVYDFSRDAELIFASFFSSYNMDLHKQRGKLHWKKFIVLMNHLDEKTAFKKVVGYRTMKVPKADKNNQEQIAHIRKMKELYSLDERTSDERMNDAFTAVAHAFKGAKAGD